jgi:hypothetical protein
MTRLIVEEQCNALHETWKESKQGSRMATMVVATQQGAGAGGSSSVTSTSPSSTSPGSRFNPYPRNSSSSFFSSAGTSNGNWGSNGNNTSNDSWSGGGGAMRNSTSGPTKKMIVGFEAWSLNILLCPPAAK